MTERLYYRDSFLREFDAKVLSSEREGERWRLVLDRTAFYPTSGGQPHDLGTLGGVPVVEVVDAEENKVVHYTSTQVAPGPTHGQVDWTRRIDHMQQHTGQHLLSAAFIELFHFPTVSFHLGREESTIDLEAPSVVPRHLEEAERRTNEIIFEDRVVAVRFGTAEELAEVGIRKKVDREGILRAIEVEGFDRQPCGGTHLARTGQAGLLLVRGIERRRDLWRVEFICGYRALSASRRDFAALGSAASTLSCGLKDVPALVEKTIADRREQHSAMKRLEERLADLEALSLLADSKKGGAQIEPMIVAAFEEATPEYLRLLGAKLTGEERVIALLASRTSGQLVMAQSKGCGKDMGKVLKELFTEFAGKGGGSKDFAQVRLADPSQTDLFLQRAEKLVRAANLS